MHPRDPGHDRLSEGALQRRLVGQRVEKVLKEAGADQPAGRLDLQNAKIDPVRAHLRITDHPVPRKGEPGDAKPANRTADPVSQQSLRAL